MGRANRHVARLVVEHWQFTAHRVAIRPDGVVSCPHCSGRWQLRAAGSDELAALAAKVHGELVDLCVVAAE
jgi:hypothetical protein